MEQLGIEATIERRLLELQERRRQIDRAIARIQFYLGQDSTDGNLRTITDEARVPTCLRLRRAGRQWRTLFGQVLAVFSGCEALWQLGV
jgi:hypothetical protein